MTARKKRYCQRKNPDAGLGDRIALLVSEKFFRRFRASGDEGVIINMEKDEKLISSEELSRIVGGSVRTLQTLTKEGHITCLKKGNHNRYDLYQAVKEYIAYQTKKEARKFSSLDEEKTYEETRLKRAKADAAELELEELKGNLHASADVEALTTDLVLFVRSNLLSLPGMLAMDVAEAENAAEASEIIKSAVHRILNEMADYRYDPEEYRRRVRERQGWTDDREEYSGG